MLNTITTPYMAFSALSPAIVLLFSVGVSGLALGVKRDNW